MRWKIAASPHIAIDTADVVRGGCGIRAQAVDRDGSLVDDFRIGHEDGITTVRNAPSPAATSSLAIAEFVVDLIEDHHTPSGRKRRRRWVKLLLRGRLDAFLAEARQAFPPNQTEAGAKALAYFEKNRERMRYRHFREHGYFIGSGVVEAACKTLVAQRLKGSGMGGERAGVPELVVASG